MRLLIVGSDKIFAIENQYVKYLREAGCEVFQFSAQSSFYDYYQKRILNKIIFRLGLSRILQKINDQFKEAIQNFKPDVIWVFKGMEIFPETLKWAKAKNIKLVNYNPDNPFVFSGKGSGNSNLKQSIGLYDLHLTYNTEVKKEMEKRFLIQTGILPFGFDVTNELFENCNRQEEIIKACFLGNPDKYRAAFLLKLAESGIELDVYGNDWNKFMNHPNINLLGVVLGDSFWLTLHKYRLQLNLDRPHTLNTHNMRSFEIPGVGGIQLAPYTNDHATYFNPETEIFLYNDVIDCILQIKKILALPKVEADFIRNNARKRSVESGYSYKDRSAQALAFIKSLYE
jgi:spore maturation protein CgeB